MREKIRKILEFYREGLSLLKYLILSRITNLADKFKLSVRKTTLLIHDLPEPEREKTLALTVVKLQKEKEELQRKVEELEAALDEKRKKKLAEIIKKVAEAEKASQPVSMAELLRRLKLKGGVRLFRKPVRVYSFDMKYIGDLYDWELTENGWRFVIRTPTKELKRTPTYVSVWDCWIRPEHIHHQLPHFMVINLVEDEDGKWLKLGPEFLDMYYKGVPVDKIVAFYQKRIKELQRRASEAELHAEIASINNISNEIAAQVGATTNTYLKSLYENMHNTIRSSILPTAFAAMNHLDYAFMEVHRSKSIAEAALSEVDRISGRLQNIQKGVAPERIIATLNNTVERLEQVNAHLAEIIRSVNSNLQALRSLMESYPKQPEKPKKGE